MARSRVAYVINVFPKLSETFIATELAELHARGVEVLILSLRQPGESLRHHLVEKNGLLARTLYDSAHFLTALREFKPHFLHAHFATEPAFAAWGFSRQLGIPFTLTTHGYDIFRKPPADFKDRVLAAKALVTVSAANAQYIEKHFGVPLEHIHLIPCGIDTGLFVPKRPQASDDPPLIVCVARHVPVKNLTLLLQACAELRKRGVLFRCALVGDGPCRAELEATRAALGLEEQVLMSGASEQLEVVAWWQRARIAVLTSHNEGSPVSLMEAASCGVPAVATRVGGIPELIEENVTGFLTPPGEVKPLAEALERLLTEAPLWARMSAAARDRACRCFSVRQQVDSLLGLWNNLGLLPERP